MRRLRPSTLAVVFALGLFVRASPAQPASAPRGDDGALVLTYNVDTESITGRDVRCGIPGGGYSRENRYYRVFDLSAYPQIAEGFHVTSVSAGVYVSVFPDSLPAQEGTLRLHNLTHPPDGGIDVDSLELIAETTFGGIAAPDDRGFLATVDIQGAFSPDALLTVEMELPSGNPKVTGLTEGFDIAGGRNEAGFVPGAFMPLTFWASDECGISIPSDIWPFVEASHGWVLTVTGTVVTTSSEGEAVAQRVTLGQNFPNPAVASVTVPFSLARSQHVRLSVADVLGREVLVAADAVFGAGDHTLTFDLRSLPSGLYVYRLATEDGVTSRTLTVTR